VSEQWIGPGRTCSDTSQHEEWEVTPMVKVIRGKVYGKMIELDEDLGLAEGQEVEVQVKVLSTAGEWGEGLRRSAGALADDPYWDAIMEEIYQARKRDTRREIPE